MADTSIEWTEKVWNPILGCNRVSAGCGTADEGGCYAERLAFRLAAMGQAEYRGLTHRLPDGKVRWTGKVVCLPERLEQPLKWRKPVRIFVNSMSDLFHEDVPDEFIAQVFAVMTLADRHTFQVLTKRPERMARLVGTDRFIDMLLDAAEPFWEAAGHDGEVEMWNPWLIENWPMRNLWLGVSVEDQRAADERIPLLLQTPAAVRFLSCEPLLGPIELSDVTGWGDAAVRFLGKRNLGPDAISWVIAGGESGPNYRPMDLAWIRSLRDQCKAAGVPFFAKQNSGPRTHMWLPEDLQSHEFPEPWREVARV